MKTLNSVLFLLLFHSIAFCQNTDEILKWEAQAKQVKIIQDDWGIPHIYGKTDADAVFGLLYVQCQQNFPRVERNYLEILGRLSEIEGERNVFEDLQMRMIYDSAAAKEDYRKAPYWLKKLLDAFADGVNYYLYKNQNVKPVVLKRFEPWFPLMYTDGSIAPTQTGGLKISDLKNLYTKDAAVSYNEQQFIADKLNPGGSNGFAIAPSKTASGNAILYINPHVTFYFRTEVQMVSEEGLNAYGAVTWGQFFIYQGFNQHCGWMHTSSYADVADVYEEKVIKKGDSLFYLYNGKYLSIHTKQVSINFKNGGKTEQKSFTGYYTHHGPILGSRDGNWLSLRENNRSMKSLEQSWLRTKAKGLEDFKKVMDMRINNSNNTVFADDKGNIAYWHGNFMPRRDPSYNWSLPVDGTTPKTEWKGLHPVSETVHVINPKTGYIQNCNSTPFTVSGASSPKKEHYPNYMAPDGQNGRALNAIRLLSATKNITIDKITSIGYNTYLTAFDVLLPSLFNAYDSLPVTELLKGKLEKPIHLLKKWNKEADGSSVATTLAVEWAYRLAPLIPPAKTTEEATNAVAQFAAMEAVPASEKLKSLSDVIGELEKNWGTWEVAWGDINRYQRPSSGGFDDSKPSLPVKLGPGSWGSLPSFAARYMNSKKRYGVSGNSFIAAVEFGKKVKAKTIMTGGESFDPSSKHFNDQASRFIEGKFKDIYFYKEEVMQHKEKEYIPGTE